jgi:hypothetical protein
MDTASRQLQSKFNAARNLFTKINEVEKFRFIESTISELNALEIKFALSTNHLFMNVIIGKMTKTDAMDEFTRIVMSEGFSSSVDRLIDTTKNNLKLFDIILRDDVSEVKSARMRRTTPAGKTTAVCKFKISSYILSDIQRLLDVYPRDATALCITPQQVNYNYCKVCCSEMIVDSAKSELKCSDPTCGTIRELVGTVFEDSNYYNQEGQKTKLGTFNPNRHFQFWWLRIMAREPEEELGDKDDVDNLYGEKLLANLRRIIVQDKKILRLITVNDVRDMLCECDRTELNKNVPLIMKKLTGIGPPQICDVIAARVENLFTKAIEIGKRIRRDDRTNRNYYPFYIFKILDQILVDEEMRRIFYYIYIQSKETVEADDNNWEQICAELPEITYVPTDRTMGLKYRPI